MRALGFEVKKHHVRMIMEEVHKKPGDSVDFDDFVVLMTNRMSDRNSRAEVMRIFKLFDPQNSGKIKFRDLRKVAEELGERISDDEIREMIEEADRDGDGAIGPDDFYRIMRRAGDDQLDYLSSDDEY
eukprot:GHVU01049961.1.p1 GENE.GHVU01049961.1~~GHVU01049961.1.p1  ORF type:complete len:128 (+),score=32.65 GHVU01049961.1:681-1064(+)